MDVNEEYIMFLLIHIWEINVNTNQILEYIDLYAPQSTICKHCH